MFNYIIYMTVSSRLSDRIALKLSATMLSYSRYREYESKAVYIRADRQPVAPTGCGDDRPVYTLHNARNVRAVG